MMFCRLIPNLRYIGLLDDRMMAHYDRAGLLQYMNGANASEISGEQILAELDIGEPEGMHDHHHDDDHDDDDDDTLRSSTIAALVVAPAAATAYRHSDMSSLCNSAVCSMDRAVPRRQYQRGYR